MPLNDQRLNNPAYIRPSHLRPPAGPAHENWVTDPEPDNPSTGPTPNDLSTVPMLDTLRLNKSNLVSIPNGPESFGASFHARIHDWDKLSAVRMA